MSKKIRDGKFVERTAEEEVEFQRLKAKHYANVGMASKKKSKSKEAFTKIYDSQFEKLMSVEVSASAKTMFIALIYQSFKQWDKPFQISTDSFAKNGFSPATQRRALTQLEKVGLISVGRKHRDQPTITVL